MSANTRAFSGENSGRCGKMTVVAKFALIAGWTVQNVLFLFIIELEEHNLQQSFIGRDPHG